jgi:hypothetical protein
MINFAHVLIDKVAMIPIQRSILYLYLHQYMKGMIVSIDLVLILVLDYLE